MTPEEFVSRLEVLSAAAQHEQAVDLSRRFYASVEATLSPNQRRAVDSIVHVALMAVEMKHAAPLPRAAVPLVRPPRSKAMPRRRAAFG
jgi:hypothetical protein